MKVLRMALLSVTPKVQLLVQPWGTLMARQSGMQMVPPRALLLAMLMAMPMVLRLVSPRELPMATKLALRWG
jgi:hypothetical protein